MVGELFLLKFDTSMGMTQRLLEEQFADLLMELSFIFQDLIITMNFVLQTQFSKRSCSLSVKKADYFGRKEYWEQPNRFLCDLWKNQYVSIFFAPAYLSNQRKKKANPIFTCVQGTSYWIYELMQSANNFRIKSLKVY